MRGFLLPHSISPNPCIKITFPKSFAHIKDGVLICPPPKVLQQSYVSTIRSEAERRNNPPVDRAPSKADTYKIPVKTDGVTARKATPDQMISLLRRIQNSIAKQAPKTSKRKSPSAAKKKQSIDPFEEIAERKHSYGQSPRGDDDGESSVKDSATFEAKSANPVSDIATGGISDERHSVAVPDVPWHSSNFDEMKVSELRELARTKGLKGYSKLKKGELIELVVGAAQSP